MDDKMDFEVLEGGGDDTAKERGRKMEAMRVVREGMRSAERSSEVKREDAEMSRRWAAMMDGQHVQNRQPVNGKRAGKAPEKAAGKVRRNTRKGSYFTGFIGALIGMLAVCVIAVAVTAFIPRLYGVISVLLPIWSVTGYLIFDGRRKRSPVPVVIVLLVSFAGVIIIGMGTDLVSRLLDHETSIGAIWHTFAANVISRHYLMEILYRGIMPFVFVILGTMLSVPKLLK